MTTPQEEFFAKAEEVISSNSAVKTSNLIANVKECSCKKCSKLLQDKILKFKESSRDVPFSLKSMSKYGVFPTSSRDVSRQIKDLNRLRTISLEKDIESLSKLPHISFTKKSFVRGIQEEPYLVISLHKADWVSFNYDFGEMHIYINPCQYVESDIPSKVFFDIDPIIYTSTYNLLDGSDIFPSGRWTEGNIGYISLANCRSYALSPIAAFEWLRHRMNGWSTQICGHCGYYRDSTSICTKCFRISCWQSICKESNFCLPCEKISVNSVLDYFKKNPSLIKEWRHGLTSDRIELIARIKKSISPANS